MNYAITPSPDFNAVQGLKEMSMDTFAKHLMKYAKYLNMSHTECITLDAKISQKELNEIRTYQVNLVKWAEPILDFQTIRNALYDNRLITFSHMIAYLQDAMRIIVPHMYKMDLDKFIATNTNLDLVTVTTKPEKNDTRQKLIQIVQKIDFSKTSDNQLRRIVDIIRERTK